MMAGMKLGQVVATRGVAERMRESSGFAAFVHRAFQRYLRADWGELCESDRKQNDRALAHGGDRILAAYTHAPADTFPCPAIFGIHRKSVLTVGMWWCA